MSHEMKLIASLSTVRGRRRFLTSALVGGTATVLLPDGVKGNPSVVSDVVKTVLPTAADSLQRYSELIAKLPDDAVFKFYAREIRPEAVRIKEYLVQLVEILGKQFRDSPSRQRKQRLVSLGIKHADNLISSFSGVRDVRYNVAVVSIVVDNLNPQHSCDPSDPGFWQGWAMAAGKPLILLESTTESLLKSGLKADQMYANVKSKCDGIQVILMVAKDMFEAGDFSSSAEQIENARKGLSQLKAIPDIQFSLSLLDSLFIGAIKWIEKGGILTDSAVSDSATEKRNAHASFRGPSHEISLAPSGLWRIVRSVLAEILPANTASRAFACVVLISPILVGYPSKSDRFNLIYNVLPNLWPGGQYDSTDAKRRSASERLSQVEI